MCVHDDFNWDNTNIILKDVWKNKKEHCSRTYWSAKSWMFRPEPEGCPQISACLAWRQGQGQPCLPHLVQERADAEGVEGPVWDAVTLKCRPVLSPGSSFSTSQHAGSLTGTWSRALCLSPPTALQESRTGGVICLAPLRALSEWQVGLWVTARETLTLVGKHFQCCVFLSSMDTPLGLAES